MAKVQDEHLSPPPVSEEGVKSKPHAWRASLDTAAQPLFLHESTARALGLKPGDVADLTDAVLGPGSLKVHRQKVRSLLMRPPPPAIASHVASAVRCAPFHGALAWTAAAAVWQCVKPGVGTRFGCVLVQRRAWERRGHCDGLAMAWIAPTRAASWAQRLRPRDVPGVPTASWPPPGEAPSAVRVVRQGTACW